MADVPPGEQIGCTDEGTIWTYSLTFQYRSGALVRVHAAVQGCRLVTVEGYVGHEGRPGAATVLTAYLRALERQRATTTPPGYVDAPRCAPRRPHLGVATLPRVASLSAGVGAVCVYTRNGTLQREQRLTRSEVKRVVSGASGAVQGWPPPRCEPIPASRVWVLLRSAWGDMTWLAFGCGNLYGGGFLDGAVNWSPGPAMRELLNRAVPPGP
jgi:hypothetical protein